MSVGVVGATAAPPTPSAGDIKFRRMKERVAAAFGFITDPTKVEQAGDFIREIIDDLNRLQCWNFMLVTSSPITTTQGVPSYALPSNFWKIYNARKTNDVDYQLDVLRQKTFDTIFLSQRVIQGQPYVMAIRNTFRDGTISLFPTPDGVHTLTLNYFRPIPKPTSNDEYLDMPTAYQSVVLNGARARMGAIAGAAQANVRDWWQGLYEQGVAQMQRSDDDIGDEDLRFVNVEEVASRWSYQNPASRPRHYDLF